MSIVIVDCGSGNLRSVSKAFEVTSQGNHDVHITTDPEQLQRADFIVLPGVGAFGDCVDGLRAIDGMVEALEEAVLTKGTPFFGICVGMQMLADRGFEHGTHKGLGWIKGEVVAVTPKNPELKIPHMGWNNLILHDPANPLVKGFKGDEHAYFVHSYHFICEEPDTILLEVEYGEKLVAAITRDNIVATQFHPEKSQATGLRLIENFLAQ